MISFVGFTPHREGRIHLWCPACHRKLSNMPRAQHDPPRAVLAQVLCPRCADHLAAKDDSVNYLDARGKPVPTEEQG